MKHSKIAGKSETNIDTNGILRNLVRKNIPIEDIVGHLKKDPDQLIGVFIAQIDKTFQKKPTLKGMTADCVQARANLGAALWAKMRKIEGVSFSNEHADKWGWRLHPYASKQGIDVDIKALKASREKYVQEFKDKEGKPRPTADLRGGWFVAFCGSVEISNIDALLVAEKIFQHLFVQEIKKYDGMPRLNKHGNPTETGLLEAKARSIANSVNQCGHSDAELQQFKWTISDFRKYNSERDFAKHLFQLMLALEQDSKKPNNAAKLGYSTLGDARYKQFELARLCESDIDADEKARLLSLHSDLQNFYKRIIATSKRGDGEAGRNRLSTRFPKDCDHLLKLLGFRQNNANIDALIREGKVEYYRHHRSEGNQYFSETELSDLRTSTGLESIKRNEHFSRIWRTVKDQATRTARALADPNQVMEDGHKKTIIDDDVLSEKLIRLASGDAFDDKRYEQQLQMLFGEGARRFVIGKNDEQKKKLLFAFLKIISKIRNDVAHFSHRSQFTKTLAASISNFSEVDDAVQNEFIGLYTSDKTKFKTRVQDTLIAAGFYNFVGISEGRAFQAALEAQSTSDLVIPKFNRVLRRVSNTKSELSETDLRHKLPNAASESKLKDDLERFKFVSLKLAYEKLFPVWLKDLDAKKLGHYVDETIQLEIKLAKKPNADSTFLNLIKSKSSQIDMPTHDGIEALFYSLSGSTAREMRDQNAYEPNPAKAREQAQWIEDFKYNLLAQAFCDFLEDRNFGYLLEKKNLLPSPQEPNAFGITYNKPVPAWAANLYIFLHFVPVGDVSMLLHQFKKMKVLEGDAALLGVPIEETQAPLLDDGQLRDLLSFFLEMHDDKFTGQAAPMDFSAFRHFYEDPNDFQRVFQPSVEPQGSMVGLQRRLREVLRHGHLDKLNTVFIGHKVPKSSVEIVLENEVEKDGSSKIADLQSMVQSTHKSITQGGGDTEEICATYEKYFVSVDEHRKLAAEVKLKTHIDLHHLMMRVHSRLADFATQWERDRLFIYLAMLKLQETQMEIAPVEGEDPKSATRPKMNVLLKNHSRHDRWPKWLVYLNEDNRLLFEQYFGKEKADIRNNLAHHNALSSYSDDINLTNELNQARELMRYDRKRKNNVSKAIIDLLEREGVIAQWRMENHQMVLDKVSAKRIQHLKNSKHAAIFEDLHSEGFIKLVTAILGPQKP